MNKKETIIAIVMKSVAIVLILVGVLLNIFGGSDFMTGAKSLFYFTIQSNIVAAIIWTIDLVYDVRSLLGKEAVRHKVFNYFKLVAATGVSLTLIVFWTLLSPQMPVSYLYSIPNLTLHTFGPLLVILAYIFFVQDFKPKKTMIMVTWTFPLFYLAFAMILTAFQVDFGHGMKVPYFFLDYETYGWFRISKAGIGVFYWCLIVLVLVYGIGYGVDALNQLAMKRKKLV